MADKAASVLARLKNKSKVTERSNQLCMQLFCQEEFLRRVQESRYGENFILKGGLFIFSLTNFESRATVDVDFLLRSLPNTPGQIRLVLDEITSVNTGNEFISFEITSIDTISIEKKYAGISASIVAKIKNTKTPFKVDFGFGDVIVPHQEKRMIPTQLDDFRPPIINTYSLETTIAEKIDAILYLMEFSSRMKDYFDVFYLSNRFDFDGVILKNALTKTFENRSRDFGREDFTRMIHFRDDISMQKKWDAIYLKMAFQKKWDSKKGAWADL